MKVPLPSLFQVKTRTTEEALEKTEKSANDEAKAMASMRLAYQDLSLQQKTQVHSACIFETFFAYTNPLYLDAKYLLLK